jgi:transposase
MTETENVLGIDISKSKFYAALLKSEKKSQVKVFDNSWEGFEQLQQWLKEQKGNKVHACMEATSTYGHALATYLHAQEHQVSIVNPARIKGFAQSRLSRTKNDRADATTIARFCSALKPQAWTPPAPDIAQLQTYSRRLKALEQMKTQEKNRLKTADVSLKEDIEAHIQFIDEQMAALKKRQQELIQNSSTLQPQQELLTSIVGIGEQTATVILAEIGSIEQFSSARQLAAFAGLTPQEHQSGTSVKGKTRLFKIGNPHLRKALYFPALNAIRRCPQVQAMRERLFDAGKNKMQVVGAVMHKLIRVVYGVLKSGQPFDQAKLGELSLPLPATNEADILLSTP